ncbi:hypothetical protein AURDEDRAFT_117546 [Auricularia subglabra TFB-10046 SS5]|uniref:Queuosine 5'-phosphate N-glycosylase/hydrolase n=1 Tax=Auricularia subglabra (strain TFB-10046 / SS5) TaxID=717982 RepID=J0WQM2_AURST|nr:hypothetical protein AURDEDRAFT_117546 [Auricularia subglabra TFB-10046 SS5]
MSTVVSDEPTSPQITEKPSALVDEAPAVNPVVTSAEYVYNKYHIVQLNPIGIAAAAEHIQRDIERTAYSPCTWRTHPLHLLPPEVYARDDPRTKATLDWIFLVSSLNFSFWSDRAARERFGVAWRRGWADERRTVHTGYWSLVAALDRALETGRPVIDPRVYSSMTDEDVQVLFAQAPNCQEGIPLPAERAEIMRENGNILCTFFGGSFQGFMDEFQRAYDGRGTALQMVQMVVDTFPSFRDEVWADGRQICFWKRAQILVAEIWAAFHPLPEAKEAHPFFPQGIHQLTMFADYRVPQILHHLNILTYPPALEAVLRSGNDIAYGSPIEMSIRAASILAVEAIRDRIPGISSVLVDFFLWDLAKRVEAGEEVVEGIATQNVLPAHRTRSIWY